MVKIPDGDLALAASVLLVATCLTNYIKTALSNGIALVYVARLEDKI